MKGDGESVASEGEMNLNDLVEALTGTLPLTAEDCGCGDERVHAALESQFRDITDALVRKLHHRQWEDFIAAHGR